MVNLFTAPKPFIGRRQNGLSKPPCPSSTRAAHNCAQKTHTNRNETAGIYGLRQHLKVTQAQGRAKIVAMSEPVSSIRNLGPAFEQSLASVGITTAEQLREIGADTAYEMLLRSGHRPHFIGYYVLVMGLQGRPWNDCKGDEKKALRVKFDKMKARAIDPQASEFERMMNIIGVRQA